MKRFALIVTLMFFASMACANDTGYVSPESYAINEADMTDYFDVPAPRKLNIDEFDDIFQFSKDNNIRNNIKSNKNTYSNYTNQREYSDEFLNSLYANL